MFLVSKDTLYQIMLVGWSVGWSHYEDDLSNHENMHENAVIHDDTSNHDDRYLTQIIKNNKEK